MGFDKILPFTGNVIVYSEFESIIEIDSDRKVTHDYAARAMRGFQINQAIGGVAELLASDQVYSFSGPVVAMCNTSPSNTRGTHCVVICIDKKTVGGGFDSFGMPPMASRILWNTHNNEFTPISAATVCGYYVIAYSLAKLQGFSLSEFIEIFSSDIQQNDTMVFELIHSLL